MIKANRRNFLFEEVKQTAPEKNGFDLSHENKQTCRAGKVYPFEILEALPNDDFEIQVEQFVRLQPMLSPTMHRVKSYWHWFFCPNRLTWKYWEEFISRGNGKKLPANQEYTPPEPPQISFYDLLQLTPSFAELRFDTVSGNGSYDDAIAYYQTRFPQYGYIHGVTVLDTNATGSGTFENNTLICHRTSRVANALSVPDTMIPFGYIHRNGDNGDFWIVQLSDNVTFPGQGGLQENLEKAKIQLQSVKLSLMPFVAYFRIWTEYYRDENLDEDFSEMLDYFYNLTGVVDFSRLSVTELGYFKRLFYLNYRCWEKDYFTTATQLPQKSPDVEIPGTGSPDTQISASTSISGSGLIMSANNSRYQDSSESFANGNANFQTGKLIAGTSNSEISHYHSIEASKIANNLSAETTITTSGSGETIQPTTVAQVRRAFALQRWFEKAVRTGTRYIESLKAFFNSDAGDARLQRCEYIGGSSSPIQISDVVQTSATDDNSDTVQGNLAGYGMSSDTTDFIRYHAPEHGFIIGCFSILARTSYSQGLPRLFSRETWLDYAWPEFEHIGEQAIRQKELACAPLSNRLMNNPKLFGQFFGGNVNPNLNDVFGYQSRYSEYKQLPDRFGSGFGSSLDFWSLGRIFDSAPTLSADFVHAQVSDRNFAVVGNDVEKGDYLIPFTKSDQFDEAYDYDTYVCDFWLDIKKVTSLTLYSEPI